MHILSLYKYDAERALAGTVINLPVSRVSHYELMKCHAGMWYSSLVTFLQRVFTTAFSQKFIFADIWYDSHRCLPMFRCNAYSGSESCGLLFISCLLLDYCVLYPEDGVNTFFQTDENVYRSVRRHIREDNTYHHSGSILTRPAI
jgi:hypothetical protein